MEARTAAAWASTTPPPWPARRIVSSASARAVGAVDGDGRADLVAAAGAGGASLIRVFDAAGNLKSEFQAYPGFNAALSVAVGDVDGDFKAEIITGAGPGGGPHVKVFRSDGA